MINIACSNSRNAHNCRGPNNFKTPRVIKYDFLGFDIGSRFETQPEGAVKVERICCYLVDMFTEK